MANVVADDDAEMAEGAVGGAVGGAEGGADVTQLSKVVEGKRSASRFFPLCFYNFPVLIKRLVFLCQSAYSACAL